MKIAAFTSYGPTLASVRGPLLQAMVQAGHEVLASAPDCSPGVVRDLERLGVEHRQIALSRRGLNPIRDIAYCRRVFRFLAKENIELCFLYTVKPVVFGSFAARLAGVPRTYALITGLGYAFMGHTFRQRVLTAVTSRLYKWALNFNQWVFFQNSDDRQLFIHAGLVRAEKSSVVNGSGVDLVHYARQPMPTGAPVFLMIARLLRAKGLLEYLSAAEELKRQYPQCRFLLVARTEAGPDAVDVSVVQCAVQSGVLEYFEDVADVRSLLASCSVYVLPSYREGTPRSVLEAMSVGRAIITTNAPGCRETVEDGTNGFTVPVRDVGALTAAMQRFIMEPGLGVSMGAASRRLAEEKFDVRVVNEAMLKQMGLLR